jgi:hypothetical protein
MARRLRMRSAVGYIGQQIKYIMGGLAKVIVDDDV